MSQNLKNIGLQKTAITCACTDDIDIDVVNVENSNESDSSLVQRKIREKKVHFGDNQVYQHMQQLPVLNYPAPVLSTCILPSISKIPRLSLQNQTISEGYVRDSSSGYASPQTIMPVVNLHVNETNLDDEQSVILRRKIRNRESAQRARDRQKAKMKYLEEEVNQLRVKNEILLKENQFLKCNYFREFIQRNEETFKKIKNQNISQEKSSELTEEQRYEQNADIFIMNQKWLLGHSQK